MDVESRTLEAAQKFLGTSAATQASHRRLDSCSCHNVRNDTLPCPSQQAKVMKRNQSLRQYFDLYLQQDHADNKSADVSGLAKASGDLAE